MYLVIKSDSAYLVKSMKGPIEKWQRNEWKTSTRTPVKNHDLWEQIPKVADIENLATKVDFWHVRREQNKEADDLAN